MTHKELVQIAMPLKNLTQKQWDILVKHFEEVKRSENAELIDALLILETNQARIEVLSNYNDYYFDTMDDPVTAQEPL